MTVEKPAVRPRRLAVKYAPPTLIIEYATEASEGLQHYSIHLKKLHKDMDPEKVALKLFARYPRYLDPSYVKRSQVTKLVTRLLANARDQQPEPVRVSASFQSGEIDLNVVSEFQLRQAKAAMDVDFHRHLVNRNDPGYVYDKQTDFGAAVEDSGWDDDDE